MHLLYVHTHIYIYIYIYGCGCQSCFGIPFWGFRCTTHLRAYFSGDWDVHWGYGVLTHGHMYTSVYIYIMYIMLGGFKVKSTDIQSSPPPHICEVPPPNAVFAVTSVQHCVLYGFFRPTKLVWIRQRWFVSKVANTPVLFKVSFAFFLRHSKGSSSKTRRPQNHGGLQGGYCPFGF